MSPGLSETDEILEGLEFDAEEMANLVEAPGAISLPLETKEKLKEGKPLRRDEKALLMLQGEARLLPRRVYDECDLKNMDPVAQRRARKLAAIQSSLIISESVSSSARMFDDGYLLRNAPVVRALTETYFADCVEMEIPFSLIGYASALGIEVETLHDMIDKERFAERWGPKRAATRPHRNVLGIVQQAIRIIKSAMMEGITAKERMHFELGMSDKEPVNPIGRPPLGVMRPVGKDPDGGGMLVSLKVLE